MIENQGLAGRLEGAAKQAREPGRIARYASRVNDVRSEINRYLDHMNQEIDRLEGARPEQVDTTGGMVRPSAIPDLDEMSHAVNSLDTCLARASDLLCRLREL